MYQYTLPDTDFTLLVFLLQSWIFQRDLSTTIMSYMPIAWMNTLESLICCSGCSSTTQWWLGQHDIAPVTSHWLCQCHRYLPWFCSSALLQNSCNPIIAMITLCDDRHCHSCQTVAQSMGRARHSCCWQCQQQYSCFWSYRFQDRSLAQQLYVMFTHQLWSLPDLSCRSIWSSSLILLYLQHSHHKLSNRS